jgi:hypothetical protein
MDEAKPLSPLDVLMQAMRKKWEAKDDDGAVDIARAAAPYMHARVSARASSLLTKEVHRLTDAELDTLLAELEGREEAPPPDPQ